MPIFAGRDTSPVVYKASMSWNRRTRTLAAKHLFQPDGGLREKRIVTKK